MVQDIASGAASSTPVNLVEINSKLYFSASTSTYGRELYSYDGSSVLRVTDVASGAGNGVYPSTANVIMGLNNVVYFSGSSTGTGYQLYKFDPSTGNATLVYNINPGGDAAPSNFVVYKGNLYFSAFTSTAGREIWWFDGTTTNMVTDLNPGIGNSAATDFYVWANNLYFNASNGTSGFELFRINDPTSVKNVAFGGQLSVFPNPAPGDVTLDLSLDKAEALRISVYDIQGRIVWEKAQTRYNAGTTKIVLPATRFAAGTYCYLLQNADGRQAISGSFIKE
jgi:ELWxxDGT repeat protein